ncbi:MAG TPA: right-handed parallel beta-helix repeat-containing protein [Flavipsychrobacter sp.]|nr:right-handed parallel beta-helix repeat-containing protein [Flavipsychrobacter sp.]
MKKIYLFVLLLLSWCCSDAQTLTINGSGTSSSYLYSPMYSFAGTPRLLRIAMHYPSSQLTSGLMPSGASISSIAFERASGTTNTLSGTPNMKIYLQNRPSTSADMGAGTVTWATEIAGAVLVYDGDPTAIVGNGPGWKTFNFGTGAGAASTFSYTGGALVVYSEYTQTAAPSATINWLYQTAATGSPAPTGWTTNSTKYTVSSTTSMPATMASSSANHPHTQFTYTTAGCATPPTPGKASVSTATPCQGQSITLQLSGNSSGAGQSYDWQTASSASGPFSSVSGSLAAPVYVTNAPLSPGTIYYRAAVTCNSSTAYSDTIALTTPAFYPSGTYTINSALPTGGTNFQTFTAAANAIKCGITGPITFNVSPGSYNNDHFWLDSVNNVNVTNTITINGGGATLNYTGTAADPAAIRINRTSYVTINNLKIFASGTADAFGICLTNNSDNNTIQNCSVTVDTTATSTTVVPIIISGAANAATTAGSDCDHNIITGSILNGGYYSITAFGSATSSLTGNVITNNQIKNQYLYGVYLQYNDGTLVEGNEFTRYTRTNSSTTAAVLLSTSCQNVKVSKNRIHNLFDAITNSTSTCYPIYISGSDATPGNENIISNNLIYNINNNAGTIYGIYTTGSDYGKYYHNTIVLNDQNVTTSETTRGIYQTTAASGLDFQNNIIVVQRSGLGTNHGLYMNTAATTWTANANNYYVGGAANNYLGYSGGDKINLAAWQPATLQDANSYEVNPVFSNAASGNYTPFSAAIDNVGIPVGILTDILNASRSASTPDIGAYEFNVPLCTSPPTAGKAQAAPATLCSGGSVTFGLTGSSTGVGQTYVWESAATPNGPFFAVSAASNTSTFVSAVSVPEYYRCAVTCNASTAYSDTIFVNAVMPLSGTYSINKNAPASSTNFPSFGAAMTALNCGIAGPVVLNVTPGSGPYNERFTFPASLVTTSINTLRINGNGVWLMHSTSVSADRAAILMDGHDYITIDSLNIDVRGNTYGYGIHLINDADNDTISRCTIITDTASTSTNYMGIALGGSATSYSTAGDNNNLVIERNTIIGGYYGIVSYGSSSEIAMNNIYRSNIIKETYFDGIYLYYSQNPTVSGNDISRSQRSTGGTSAGISLSTCSGGGLIERNKIHDLFGGMLTTTNDCYGIELANSDGAAATPFIVANNLIYDMTGNGDIYGLYNTGSDYAQYYFNTVSLDNTSSASTLTTKGFYQTTAASGIEFKNNIVTITRGGTGAKHGVHFNTAATVTNGVSLDNNVYYISGAAGVNNIGGQATTAYTTLATWQNSFSPSQEMASIVIDPLYTSLATDNYIPTRVAVNDIGIPIPSVVTDINSASRSATMPDPGAYEWIPPACVAPPTAGFVNLADDTICSGSTVTFDLTGNSIGYLQTYQWQSAPTANGPYTAVNAASGSPVINTVVNATAYYRAAVTCGASTRYSDTVLIVAKNPLAGGTYTVNNMQPTGGTNFNSLQEAAEAMECGITGSVVLNVMPGSGPYVNQQMVFPSSLVTSPAKTITINGNGATLVSNCNDPSQRAAIALYGTDYVKINNLIIDASGGAYNWGVFFTQQADNNKIENCTIISSKTVTASAVADAIVFSASNTAATTGGNNGNYDTLINNTIIGGYYGIAMYGAAATPLVGNVIMNNISQDAYAYNILTVYNNGTIISGNDVSRPTRTNTTTFAGIYVNNPSANIIVEKNKVHDISTKITSSFTAYCIYLGAADATAGNPNIVRNNLVYNIKSLGIQYGLYNNGSDYSSIYNNSFSLDDNSYTGSAATAGFYQATTATGIDFRNNMIAVTRGGTGDKFGALFNTAATVTSSLTINYNNYYVNSSSGNSFIGGIASANQTTKAGWAAAIGGDANSDTLNPYYTNASTGNLTPTNASVNNTGTPLANVTTDILNVARSATTPDMGAYEFIPPTCAPPSQLVASNVTGTSATLNWVYVNNNAPALGFQYYLSNNSATPTNATLPSGSGSNGTTAGFTGLTGSTLYYAWVRSICSAGDTSAWSPPVSFRTKPSNDSARNAILLTVGSTFCNGINFNGDVGGATLEPNEPILTCEQNAGTASSVWYKFDAPASGMVKISTDFMVSAYDSLVDGKLGVFSVADSSNFSTYQILGCDDDNGILGSGWRSILYMADLTPGNRYYIKVDKNNIVNPDAAFCIEVLPMNASMISTNDNCGVAGYSNNSNWHNGKQAWVSLVDNNGLLIYNMKTNANTAALGAMPNKFYEQTGPSRLYNGTPYLNRNYEITSATAPASPVTLQFFFTDADYISLQAAKPTLTMAALNVTRLESAVCADTFNPAGFTASLLPQLANGAASGVRFINVNTPGFSTFFIHADNSPLAIRLETIAAINMGDHNRIDWNTLTEEAGDRFELERSKDASNFMKIAEMNAKGVSSKYTYLDYNASAGVNYYRLKMWDNKGEFSYSTIVKATMGSGKRFTVDIFPNPLAGEEVTVKTTGSQGGNASILLTDASGKVVLRVKMTGSVQTLKLNGLASGVYFIQYTDDAHAQNIKLTKQ